MYSKENDSETNHMKQAMAAYSPWMPAAVKLISNPQRSMPSSFLYNPGNAVVSVPAMNCVNPPGQQPSAIIEAARSTSGSVI